MSNPGPNPPGAGGEGSNDPTVIINRSGGTSPAPEPSRPSTGDATLVGKSASASESPEQKPSTGDKPAEPSAKSIHDQDTVVSPRLRQLAQTPSQPLHPPPGGTTKPPVVGSPPGGSQSRLYMLIGVVAVLVLLMVILLSVIVTTRLGAARTPTPTATLQPTPTFPPTATLPPASPTPSPTPVPPSPTPRPAPTELAIDVLARVTPPEGVKLKVRETPSAAGKVLGELDQDAQVAIVDGPTDANGIRWWKVDDGKGLVGWSAEGLGTDKYLAPVGWAK